MNPSFPPDSFHAVKNPSNGNALTSLILGIGSWAVFMGVWLLNLTLGTFLAIATFGVGTLCLLPLSCISPVMWLAAVITGHLGLKRSREMNGNGRVMAIIGMVLGYIGIGLVVVTFIIILVMALITGGFTFMNLQNYPDLFNNVY